MESLEVRMRLVPNLFFLYCTVIQYFLNSNIKVRSTCRGQCDKSSEVSASDVWDEDPLTGFKAVVYEQCLRPLFKLCQTCGGEITVTNIRQSGFAVVVTGKCSGGCEISWSSSPTLSSTQSYLINTALPASYALQGQTFTDMQPLSYPFGLLVGSLTFFCIFLPTF